MKILINYADNGFFESQKLNTQTGYIFGFNRVINYNRKSLDHIFVEKNKHILNRKRGAGYWIWKPYIILQTLKQMNEDDILFYCDSGSYFINKIDTLLKACETDDISLFYLPYLNRHWTKMDAYYYMKIEPNDSKQVIAAFILCKKRNSTIKIMEEFLYFCEDSRIVTDDPNVCGLPNDVGFVEHRHDQSVLSLLADKYKIRIHRDPSQWGNQGIGLPEDNYPQIINHTRCRI